MLPTSVRAYQLVQQVCNRMNKYIHIISRADAKRLGMKRFFIGEACLHGHISERYVSKGTKCVECQNQKDIAAGKKNETRGKLGIFPSGEYGGWPCRVCGHDGPRDRQKKCRKCVKRRRFARRDPNKLRAWSAASRCRRRQAMPRWLSNEQIEEIKRFYQNCPDGYVVDHWAPLAGKNVCGLHVIANLQYLTALENGKKFNKFPWPEAS